MDSKANLRMENKEISDLENRTMEITEAQEEKTNLKWKELKGPVDTINQTNMYITGVPEAENKRKHLKK